MMASYIGLVLKYHLNFKACKRCGFDASFCLVNTKHTDRIVILSEREREILYFKNSKMSY